MFFVDTRFLHEESFGHIFTAAQKVSNQQSVLSEFLFCLKAPQICFPGGL